MKTLPQAFLERMKILLGEEFPAFLASYDKPAARGLRVNTLKILREEFLRINPFALAPSAIAEDSSLLADGAEGLGKHPYHAAGLYYVQEPSAMLPVSLAGVKPGMRVLDLCAAPGGKSGALAARLGGEGFLLANELVPNRARTLKSTLERMGVVNAAVTCAKPEAVAAAFPSYFDVVLVDAPCSGEGMFRKDDEAVAAWSEAHVNSCAARQALILESASPCVTQGGALVYSTCTFSYEENEGVVESFARAHPDFVIEDIARLYPHRFAGEGHFAARLRKLGGGRIEQEALPLKLCRDAAYHDAMRDIFRTLSQGEAYLVDDGRVTLLRGALPKGLSKLHVLSAGAMAGEIVRGRFAPSHALFMAAHGGEYARKISFSPGAQQLAAFMAGEEIPCDAILEGYSAVAVDGYPLGFGKAGNGTLKNHVPKGLRAGQNSTLRH